MNNAPRPRFLRVSARERVFFAKRLGILLRSGTPITRALTVLAEQARSKSVRYIYNDLVVGVTHGRSLSQEMEAYGKIFGDFSIHLVRVGEVSGTLPENLEYLADELKKAGALRKKMLSALVYPAIVVAATILIALAMTLFIFPKITPIFQSKHTTLPLSTRILIAVSHFLMQWWMLMLAGMAATAFSIILLMKKSPRARLICDRALTRIPIFGSPERSYSIATFCRTLGLLLKSDVRAVQALTICTASVRNSAYGTEIARAAEETAHGGTLAHSLSTSPLFPAEVIHMIAIGEETGNLPASLLYISEMYEEEIETLTKNLSTAIEPVLMIGMGIVVGFIAIAIITPIYGITQSMTVHH